MKEHHMRRVISGIAVAILVSMSTGAFAAAADYRFELAGTPQKSGKGANIVSVKLIHIPDAKTVSGAKIVESSADMGPEEMAMMTAPVKALPEQAGLYRFEIDNGRQMVAHAGRQSSRRA
jgi:hypothetical protein